MDISLIASVFDALRLRPPSKLALLEGREFASAHFPPTPPDVDALIVDVNSREQAGQVKQVLLSAYPQGHIIKVVENGRWTDIRLDELEIHSSEACVYIPSLGEGTSFESFAEIVAHLRAPDGCPWDREQTHQTLRTHLLEEAYETLAAMDADDPASMMEEFGDLLLQIMLNSQIAREDDEFTITEVIKHIYDKIIRRHPHVFGDLRIEGVGGVLQNWEKLKASERDTNGEAGKGLLDGVPLALPALTQAQEYQDRAARVGFDWPGIEGVLDKIAEEIQEVKQATNGEELADELGDLFFALVNLARWKKVDAESALRACNLRFKRRFAHVEQGAQEQGKKVSELSLDEMESLWQEAKRR